MKHSVRRALTSVTLIVCVAFAARLGFAWSQARQVPEGVLAIVPFQHETGNIAAALAEGRGFSDVFRTGTGATAWLAPVYPLLLAGVFKLFGVFTLRSFFAVCFLNIGFSSAACVPVYFAGRRLAGIGVASGAAWLWALFPNAVMMPFEWIWDTSLSALLAAVILWATLALSESLRLRDTCLYGLLWGLALLTNPALGALLPFLLGWALLRGKGGRKLRWRGAALAVGVAILCCVPWTIRNYREFHGFVALRSNFPFELWLGNNDILDENARAGRRVLTRREEALRYTKMGEPEYMAQKGREALAFIESHPGLELRLVGRKLLSFWLGTDTPVRNFVGNDSRIATSSDRWLIRLILLSSFLTAIGAAAGVFVLWRKRIPGAFAASVFALVFPCVYYVTHADLRYRSPIDPVLMLLTAVAVWAVVNTVRRETAPPA